jgi:hypothetical protein
VDVTAAGTGSPVPDSPVRLSGPGGTSPSAGPVSGAVHGAAQDDAVGAHLQQLSSPQIHHLLNTIDAQRFPLSTAALDGLLQTAGTAVSHHDMPRAIGALTEYVNRNPEHASGLLTASSLNPIQGEVKELLRTVTLEARNEAVRLVGQAGAVWDAAARYPQGLDGAAVLAVAERFIESGQLANYIRAAGLGEAVIAYYGGSELITDGARRRLRAARARRRPVWGMVGRMWRRTPMLVLLLGWLALGVSGGIVTVLARAAGQEVSASTLQAAVEVWSVGFLALVVFQFFARVLRGG